MPGALQAMVRLAERRLPALTRYRRAEALPIQLHRKRIYILPTGFGLGFAALLLVMLTGSLNYANNAALMLTCLLGAAGATSMLMAFRNLNGVTLREIRAGRAVAGQPMELALRFDATRAHLAIGLDLDTTRMAFSLSPDGASCNVVVNISTAHRGWQPLPRLRVWSTWPLGLFRAWSWLHPQQTVLVWPRAEVAGPAPRGRGHEAARTMRRMGDELAALRDYRAGDPRRHIAWKVSAHHEGLLVKSFAQPQSQQQWHLDWRQLTGLDNESRIARLARWLDEASAQRIACSLHLPDETIPAGLGARHYARCMDALAKLP